jgi:hypothetical protein
MTINSFTIALLINGFQVQKNQRIKMILHSVYLPISNAGILLVKTATFRKTLMKVPDVLPHANSTKAAYGYLGLKKNG